MPALSDICEPLLRDLRYAVRVLRRTPVFTAASVLTLALAVGANTAVFSVADAVLFEPLPYPEPERLALVARRVTSGGVSQISPSVDGRTWEAVRDAAPAARSAVFSTWIADVNLAVPGGAARPVRQQRVSAGFFETLAVEPAIGRGFTADEDRPGGPAAAVLGAPLWRAFFAADPSIVGRTVMLKGAPHTVVGVMPDGFQSGWPADLWTPLRPSTAGEGGGENYQVLLRLDADRPRSRAEAEVARIGEALALERKPEGDNVTVGLSLMPLGESIAGDLRQPVLILWGAVALVLAVTCVNLAGLLLARVSRRRHEIATRMALGSGRAAVVRQLLAESLVVGLAGGALGTVLGGAAIEGLLLLARDVYDIWQPVALDARGMAVAAVLSILASLVFGAPSAFQATRTDVQSGLVQSGTRTTAGAARLPRRLLIVAQVALGVVLLVAAGLLVRTFAHLDGLAPGFEPQGLVTAAVSLDDERYREREPVTRLLDRTIEALEELPGVESAAVALELPYERLLNLGFRHMDGPEAASARTGTTSATYVSPGFFQTLRIPVKAGRVFTPADRGGAPAVAIVSDAFAREYFQGSDPIGRRIAVAGASREIVGRAGDVQVRPGWGNHGPVAAMPLVYVPAAQVDDAMFRLVHTWFSPTFIVRTANGGAGVAPAMRRALAGVDPLLPFTSVRNMGDVKAASLALQRFLMVLLASLSGLAVLLSAIGIYALIAASVVERTREIGIRLALGATASRAVRTLALPGVVLTAAGVACGSLLALLAGSSLRAFVWGVAPTDPATYAGVAVLLLVVAASASVLPALRILRLDPAATLRHE